MSDQGRWFKLWVSARGDPSLSILPIADFGRWCKFGVYTKEHGTDGTVSLEKPPNREVIHPLQTDFQVPSFEALIDAIKQFPNIEISTVSLETNPSVSFQVCWQNWLKYQGDFSTERVRRFRKKMREMKRSKTRGEETRGEERRGNKKEEKDIMSESGIRTSPNQAYKQTAERILERLNRVTKKRYRPIETNLSLIIARLRSGATEAQCMAVIGQQAHAWRGDPQMWPYMRPETLFGARKFESYLGQVLAQGDSKDEEARDE